MGEKRPGGRFAPGTCVRTHEQQTKIGTRPGEASETTDVTTAAMIDAATMTAVTATMTETGVIGQSKPVAILTLQ